ncbi:MAG: CHASE domain-containing protein, partial [Pseudohongiellaceae bacterium]
MSFSRRYFKNHRVTPYLFSSIILFAGLGITVFLWQQTREQDAANLQTIFETAARRTTVNIQHKVENFQVVMRGVQGFFGASNDVSYEDFRDYVSALQVPARLPGVLGVAYVQYVPREELPDHLAQIRSRVSPDYTIFPAGDRPRYAPIVYIEPMEGDNLAALGFDILTVSAAREAMDLALLQNDITITAPMTLVQDSQREATASFVMYLPIYRLGAATDTLAQRQQAITGWVDVPFRMIDLMNGMAGEISPILDLEIHDGEPRGDASLLYHSDEVPYDTRTEQSQLQFQLPLTIGGREWTLRFSATPEFQSRLIPDARGPLVLLNGGAISVLLSILALLLIKGRLSAESRFRRLFNHAGDGIVVLDEGYHIIDCNLIAPRLLGYERDELLNLQPLDLVSPTEHERLSRELPIMTTGKAHLAEWTLLKKDGTTLPVEVHASRLDDHHFIAIIRDYSAHRKAERR